MEESGYNKDMQVGLLGLGKMGKIIGDKLMSDGHTVAVWNRTRQTLEDYRVEKAEFVVNQKLQIVHSIEEFQNTLNKPRVFWSMLPAGEATDQALQDIMQIAEAGDVVIDGGNSHFKKTEQWSQQFAAKGIKFLGIGCSGGVHAVENGFCIMAGGDADAYEYIKPLLDSLVKPYGAYNYFGKGGAGHFVKMVHNGIEYGMMQAIAEGFGVLAKSDYQLNLSAIAETWQNGSIVESFLLDMANDALTADPVLSQYTGVVDATGEGLWTILQAKEEGVPITIIEQSLEFRKKSQYDETTQATFAAKMLGALRKEFGGHVHTPVEQGQPDPNNQNPQG